MSGDNYVVFGLYKNRPDVNSALEQLEDAGFDSETVFEIVVHNGDVLLSVHAFGKDESGLAESILKTTGAKPISKIQRSPQILTPEILTRQNSKMKQTSKTDQKFNIH